VHGIITGGRIQERPANPKVARRRKILGRLLAEPALTALWRA
jgi:hypothetical protein